MATLDIKFMDLSPEATAMKIMDAAILSGCKPPDQQDYYHIITAIEDKFPMITCEEFLLAFRLNSYGEYAKKIEHFNLFSMDYLVQVLNAYYQHRAEAVIKSDNHAAKIAYEASNKPTAEQERQSRINTLLLIKKDWEGVKSDTNYKITIAWAKYDILQREKMVPELSLDEKNEYLEQAKRIRKLELDMDSKTPNSLGHFQAVRNLLRDYEVTSINSIEQGNLKAIAKGLALADWFKSLNEFPDCR